MRKYSSTIPPLELDETLTIGSDTAVLEDGSSLPVIASPDTLTLVLSPDTENEEIVTVIAHASGADTVTIVRAQESTTDRTHTAGAAVKHMVTARDLQEPHVHINATNYTENGSASLHGIGSGEGNVVGTAKTQTLTNKTINSDNNTITVTQARVTGLTDALNAKAPLVSPALSGTPTAPTASVENNSTQVATTAFVKTVTNFKQDLDSDLTAIAALSGTGFIARTADGTAALRTLVAGTGIAITNPAGIDGAPTISATSTAQSGSTSVSYSSGTGTATVTSATTTASSIIVATGSSADVTVAITSVGTNTFTIGVRHVSTASGSVTVRWIVA